MPPVLELASVGVRFGTETEPLSDVDLILAAGAVAVVTGPPNAGKSLLARVAALVARPCRGEVRLFGERCWTPPLDRPARLRRRIGLAESAPALVESLDAIDNVALPLRLGGMDRATARRRAGELYGWLGGAATPLPAMSPGQRRRVGLARAIIGDPGLVVVDDADRLDADRLDRLPALIARLRGQGTAFLLTAGERWHTRDAPEVARLRLDRGRLHAAGAAVATTQPRPVHA